MIVETILAMLPALPTQSPRDWKYDDARDVAVELADVTDDIDEAARGLVTAYAETRFRRLVGDHGKAFGVYQLHGVPSEIGINTRLSTPIALERLRQSAKACPSAPMAPYIGGCSMPAARRASAYRMAIVARMKQLLQRPLHGNLPHVPMDRREDRRVALSFQCLVVSFRCPSDQLRQRRAEFPQEVS
jgi:hypothetical protein